MNKIKDFLFRNISTKQTAVKNVIWLAVGQIGSRLFRALIIIYAARVLGAEGYGIFSYVLGLAGFFSIFSDIGITAILTRNISQKPNMANSNFATSLVIKVVLLVLTSLLIIFLAPYFSKIDAAKPLLPLAALLVIFDNLREFSNAYFRGKEEMQYEALLTTITNVAITVFGFIILAIWATPKALTLTYALSASTGTLVGIYLLREHFFGVFKNFKKNLVKPILNSAWPIAIAGMLGAFMLNIDIVMIGMFRDATNVGLYSAGQKIIGLLYTFAALLATSLFPIISRFVEKGENKKSAEVMENGMTVVFLIAIPIAVGGVILAKDIMGFLFGPEFQVENAVLAFRILLLTPLIIYPGSLLGNYILAYDEQKKTALITGLGSLANVTFNLLLIPAFGIVGAAISTIGSTSVLYGSIWKLAKKINDFQTLKHLKKIALSAALMGIVVLILKSLGIHLLINIALSAIFYLGVLYLLKEKSLKNIISVLPF